MASADDRPLVDDDRVVERQATMTSRWRWGGLFSIAVGVFFLAVGGVALVRAGLDDPIDEPIIEVLGFGHTAVLGIVELAVGFVLVVAGASMSGATTEAFTGMLLVVAGILGWAEEGEISASLGLENSFCVLAIVLGAAVAVVSFLTPGATASRSTRFRRQVVA